MLSTKCRASLGVQFRGGGWFGVQRKEDGEGVQGAGKGRQAVGLQQRMTSGMQWEMSEDKGWEDKVDPTVKAFR